MNDAFTGLAVSIGVMGTGHFGVMFGVVEETGYFFDNHVLTCSYQATVPALSATGLFVEFLKAVDANHFIQHALLYEAEKDRGVMINVS